MLTKSMAQTIILILMLIIYSDTMSYFLFEFL